MDLIDTDTRPCVGSEILSKLKASRNPSPLTSWEILYARGVAAASTNEKSELKSVRNAAKQIKKAGRECIVKKDVKS